MDQLRALPPDRPLKIVLVQGSHTGGHRAAAQAVKKALDELPNVEAEFLDAVDLQSGPLKDAQVGVVELFTNNLSSVRGWAFRQNYEGNPVMYWLGNTALQAKALVDDQLLERLREEQPDAILSTHSPMSSLLSHWKDAGDIDVPVHTVVTDFRAHRMWAQDSVDHYYVATDRVRRDLEKFEVPSERIEITGIPVDPKFAAPAPDKAEAKRALGLDPSRATVLMMGGSLGFGRFGEVAEALARSTTPMQMVCITGRNVEKRQELEALAKTLPMPLTVLGYTPDVEKYMDAADAIVSKPGGLTLSESFARRAPVILMEPAPGLESLLHPTILETGAALSAPTAEDVARTVESLVSDPSTRTQVDQALDLVSHPDAARAIAMHLVEDALAHRQSHPQA